MDNNLTPKMIKKPLDDELFVEDNFEHTNIEVIYVD